MKTVKTLTRNDKDRLPTVKAFLVAPKTIATDSTVSTLGPLSGDRRVALAAI
jgi:hypothetical protein